MYSETAPRDKEFVILDEEDATGKYDAAPGKDHLRRGPTFSFFLSRAAAQPATASDVIGSRSVALAPVTVVVGAQTTLVEARASQARWRFAASLIAASLVVAGTGIYYRGEVAYEAMIRKAVETKTAELTQERDHAAALANRAPAAAAPVAAPARKLDPDELATLMDRAKRLIAAGDISPARLLLERAADAQESTAALMLALTYDPDALGTQNSRNIIPDPTMARVWYQRAAQLGSADAQRRLSQLQN